MKRLDGLSVVLEAGEAIIATGVRGLRHLTTGKTYYAINGTEGGIFESSPYVTVINDVGKEYSCHQSRFSQ